MIAFQNIKLIADVGGSCSSKNCRQREGRGHADRLYQLSGANDLFGIALLKTDDV